MRDTIEGVVAAILSELARHHGHARFGSFDPGLDGDPACCPHRLLVQGARADLSSAGLCVDALLVRATVVLSVLAVLCVHGIIAAALFCFFKLCAG